MTLSYYVPTAGTYQVIPAMTRAHDHGQVQLAVDGETLPNTLDGYNSSVTIAPFNFGTALLSAGLHTFKFTVSGTNAASSDNRYNLGIDTLTLIPITGT